MSNKLGRNDPCHCGSGKKYKKCHLPLEETAHVLVPPVPMAPAESVGTGADSWDAPPCATARVPWSTLYREAKRAGLTEEGLQPPSAKGILSCGDPILWAGVIASAEKCLPHEADFKRLCADPEAFEDHCETLFSEETFATCHFTADDLSGAFQEVGMPSASMTDAVASRKLQKALLFIANEERRKTLGCRLMEIYIEFVEQERFLDAQTVFAVFQMTLDDREDGNPFLGRMFVAGLRAWEERQQASRNALIRELGVPLNEDTTMEEVEAWLEKERDKLESDARLKAILDLHPELRGAAEADYATIPQRAMDLLKFAGSERLLLRPEELAPFRSQIDGMASGFMRDCGPEGRKLSDRRARKLMMQYITPAMGIVVKAVFTQARMTELIGEIKAMRRDLVAAGDKKGEAAATAALQYLSHEEEPEKNGLLISLCFRSVMQLAEHEAWQDQGDRPPTA